MSCSSWLYSEERWCEDEGTSNPFIKCWELHKKYENVSCSCKASSTYIFLETFEGWKPCLVYMYYMYTDRVVKNKVRHRSIRPWQRVDNDKKQVWLEASATMITLLRTTSPGSLVKRTRPRDNSQFTSIHTYLLTFAREFGNPFKHYIHSKRPIPDRRINLCGDRIHSHNPRNALTLVYIIPVGALWAKDPSIRMSTFTFIAIINTIYFRFSEYHVAFLNIVGGVVNCWLKSFMFVKPVNTIL